MANEMLDLKIFKKRKYKSGDIGGFIVVGLDSSWGTSCSWASVQPFHMSNVRILCFVKLMFTLAELYTSTSYKIN